MDPSHSMVSTPTELWLGTEQCREEQEARSMRCSELQPTAAAVAHICCSIVVRLVTGEPREEREGKVGWRES